MTWAALLIAVSAGAIAAAVTTRASMPLLARRAVLDQPSERSSHTTPTLRGGGVGVIAGTLVAVAAANGQLRSSTVADLLVAGLGFGAIGLADDVRRDLRTATRFMLQVAVAVGVAAAILSEGSPDVLMSILAGVAVVAWMVSFVNAYNFMDGINGISSAEAVVAGVALGLVARHDHRLAMEAGSFALAGGALGFAPFNFPSARVFPGDVGSYFIGGWLAALIVVGVRDSLPLEAVVAPVALYVADTAVTLLRRIRRHETWWQPHRQHVYQRLVDLGWSHLRSTALVFAIAATCSLLGAVSLLDLVAWRIAADGSIVALILGYLCLPSVLDRRLRPSSLAPGAPS
ncbi:MraY family glycosyltransferase [Acidiferrimicrobium sp. IK]|uniref:MraY family glycosyltransferase n=1 Tax=Acidiferrimicrobium sp. IK TaxID=2871700 RepID=UPI0021CB54E3|nr:glycosyltransferase family 4 protein [Acidiferrimicrobium sp. IK]